MCTNLVDNATNFFGDPLLMVPPKEFMEEIMRQLNPLSPMDVEANEVNKENKENRNTDCP